MVSTPGLEAWLSLETPKQAPKKPPTATAYPPQNHYKKTPAPEPASRIATCTKFLRKPATEGHLIGHGPSHSVRLVIVADTYTAESESALAVLSRLNVAFIYSQPSDPLFLCLAIAVNGAGWLGGWVGSWYRT